MKKQDISFFEKNLTLWVLICMVIGVLIGRFIPIVPNSLGKSEFYNVSIPTTILLWIMIYPMMLKLGRSGDYAKEFLADWNGTYLHCDGYVGYKKLVGKTLCGCLVHAKRKFHEAYEINKSNEYAKQGETYLRKLFQLETKADEAELSLRERLEMRSIR